MKGDDGGDNDMGMNTDQVIKNPETHRQAEEDSKSCYVDTQNTRQELSRTKYRV